jgi:hypothetical protein
MLGLASSPACIRVGSAGAMGRSRGSTQNAAGASAMRRPGRDSVSDRSVRAAYMLSAMRWPNCEHFSQRRAGHLALQVVRDRTCCAIVTSPAAHDHQVAPLRTSPCTRSIITPDRISEPGFTLSWPAYFGAVPCVASKTAACVADVRARREAEPADLRGAGVGQVVAVQVRRRDDLVLVGAQEDLLEHGVGDAVVHEDLAGREPCRRGRPRAPAR